MKVVLIGIVTVIVIGAGGYLVFHKTSSSSGSQAQTTSTSTSDTIIFSGKMFSPAHLTVTSGTTVTVRNTSSQELQMDSDPHPVHTDDTDLNVGSVLPGHSATFTVKKTGTFGYHDHLDPSIQAKITIQ